MAALRRYMSNEHQQIATEEMSMKCLIQQTILKQKQFLDSGDSHSMSGLSGRQDLWHSGFGQSLATCCKCVVGLFAKTLRRNGLSIGLVTTSLVIWLVDQYNGKANCLSSCLWTTIYHGYKMMSKNKYGLQRGIHLTGMNVYRKLQATRSQRSPRLAIHGVSTAGNIRYCPENAPYSLIANLSGPLGLFAHCISSVGQYVYDAKNSANRRQDLYLWMRTYLP